MKIMIVDDSRAMRSFLSSILRKAGLDTEVAENGAKALEQLAAGSPPDLLLLDWHMPEMTGIELLVELRSRERFATTPIVMVTSETEAENLAAAFEAGATDYVMKPFEPQALTDKVIQLLPDHNATPSEPS